MWTLIGINGAVFLLWQTYGETKKGKSFMYRNFVGSEYNLKQGRIWTLVTSSISQQRFMHFAFNMIGLYFLGREVLLYLGPTRFLGLYLVGGMVSVLGHIAWSKITNSSASVTSPRLKLAHEMHGAHGSSGAIMATAVIYAALFPHNSLYLYGVLRVPAWAAVSGFIAWDLISLNMESNISNAGHLAGAIYGLLYYLLRLR
eukprot:TRINITY_DN13972_c0_g1_i1.p1 TRINITY_DN13972_c0_g1~~TRINITY_DN13972_c0_g1_i1.p1  ORF type:complete len:228 (-),score=13.27 TRINITY_DN13972_c0_g1_i1:66-668(-)